MDYVAGFMFSNDKRSVALVEKLKPEFQRGKLNGIGGKIEPNESPDDAMTREFQEETGVLHFTWEHFATVNNPNGLWKVYFYKTYDDAVFRCKTTEAEEIKILPMNVLGGYKLMPNLMFLLHLALADDTILLPITFLDRSFGDAKFDRKD